MASLTLAIIGAGPFGLAQAAWAADAGIDYAIIGYPMQFWREHMPEGMRLRSTAEWHLDTPGEWTMDRFFAERGGAPTGPLARERDEFRAAAGASPYIQGSVSRMPLLNGPDGPIVKTREGFPVLDDRFQSSVPRLFITSMAASGDFGPFFGFTVSARVSARQIGRAILHG